MVISVFQVETCELCIYQDIKTDGTKLVKSKVIVFWSSYYRMISHAYMYNKVFISQNNLLIIFLSVNLRVPKLKERLCT